MSLPKVFVVALTVSLLVGACSEDDPVSPGNSTTVAQPEKGTVTVRDIAFSPKAITVKAGDEVKWVFDDGGITHTVTSDASTSGGASFDSKNQTAGEFKHVFADVGEYAYHCELHTAMHGTVTVEAKAP